MGRFVLALRTGLAIAVLATTMAVAGMATSTRPASAATISYVWNNRGGSVPMYYAPTIRTNVQNWMRNGTKFQMDCWEDFQWFNGNYNTNRWFFGQAFNNGTWGYVHASYVRNQAARTPHC